MKVSRGRQYWLKIKQFVLAEACGNRTRPTEARPGPSATLPCFLPDGRHFLYRAGMTPAYPRDEGNGIYVGSLDSREYKLILKEDTYAAYASGHLLFWRDGALMAQPFNTQSLQLSGEAVPIAAQVPRYKPRQRVFFHGYSPLKRV